MPATSDDDIPFGNYHALVIGNNEYEHLPDLETAVNDARAVAAVLEEKYGFSVQLLENANFAGITNAINAFRAKLTRKDNLLIYYAGHGTIEAGSEEGFWLPINAEEGNDTFWIENSSLTRRLRGMSAKHVLVISDSCYAGTLVRDPVVAPKTGAERIEWLRRMATRRSRTAMTSGSLEPVVDGGGGGHSVFAAALLSVLWSNNKVVEAEAVYQRLRGKVALNAKQTPLYDPMRLARHEDGEFLFRPITVDDVDDLENQSLPPTEHTYEFVPVERNYVTVRGTPVREKPNSRSARVAFIPADTVIFVSGKVTGRKWYAVEKDGKFLGYVFSENLQPKDDYRRDEKRIDQDSIKDKPPNLIKFPSWIAAQSNCHSDGNTNASVNIVVSRTKNMSEVIEAEIRIRSPLYQARSVVRSSIDDNGYFSARDATTDSKLEGRLDRNGDLVGLSYGTCRDMLLRRGS